MTGIELIAAERQRQIEIEGWTPDHDDQHRYGELRAAAFCYLKANPRLAECDPVAWPWDPSWWKPKDRISNLVKAGALIAAEIDRLQRAKIGKEESKEPAIGLAPQAPKSPNP